MEWRAPSTPDALARLLADRSDTPGVVTGAAAPPEDLPPDAAAGEVFAVSTSGMAGVDEIRRRDLTVSVGAGTRIAELQRCCREEGGWLPLDGPAASRSVGGVVGAASAGPWDGSFGDLRRQLLSCEIVTWEGRRARWGRDVMKNVAGYGLTRAVAGSWGRLGVVHRATFRLWPAPECHHTVRLAESGGGASPRAADHVATGDLDRAARPDAVIWSHGNGREGLGVHFLGTRESVDLRTGRLREWAADRGLEVEDARDRSPAGAVRDADPDDPGPGAMATVERERPPEVSLACVAAGRRAFADACRRARDAMGDGLVALEGYPLEGHLYVAYRRAPSPGGEGEEDPLERLLDGLRDAPVRMERGSAEEMERVTRRRPEATRRLEDRVIRALEGRPRHWLSGYV